MPLYGRQGFMPRMQPSEAFVQSTGASAEGWSVAQSTVRRYTGGLSASARSRQASKSPTSLPCQKRSGLISVSPMASPPPGATSVGGCLAGGGACSGAVVDVFSFSPPPPPQAGSKTAAASAAAAMARRTQLDRGDLFVLRHAEGRAAAAGGDDVRVVDLEPGALERVDVVDRRAVDVGQALVVHEQAQPAVLEDHVAVTLLVEGELVLEARASAAAYSDA